MYVTEKMIERALKYGRDIAANTSRGNRTKSQHQLDCYKGALGEVAESIFQHVEEEYAAGRNEMADKRDDGGFDVVPGENVKTVMFDDNFVFVSDNRAEKYVVWRYDPRIRLIERIGTFKREDIHELPEGVGGRGVRVDEVKAGALITTTCLK